MKFLAVCFILIIYTTNFAQQYSFISYGVNDGLAQSQVTDICQDNLGNLWVGTRSGLSKFDSQSFKNFSVDDGLTDNFITKLMWSSNNQLWVASSNGMSLFDGESFKTFYFKSSQKVADIVEFKGDLYVASQTDLLKFENNEFKSILSTSELDLTTRSLCNWNDSLLFLGTNKGAFRYDLIDLTYFESDTTEEFVFIDFEIFNDHLFISTRINGILEFDILTESKVKTYSTDNIPIRNIFIDSNEIWASSKYGLIEIHGTKTNYYTEENGLTSDWIRSVFKDDEGNIWIGTNGKGILKFSGQSLMTYGLKEGLSSDLVLNVAQISSSCYVFGTFDKGIDIFFDGSIISYPMIDGLFQNSIWCSYLDDDMNCWIGTNSGVQYIKNNKIYDNEVINQIESRIRSICGADNGDLYFGGSKGLWLLENGEMSHIAKDKIYNISKIDLSKDKLFFGTRNNGLYWADLNKSHYEFNQIDLPVKNINSICVDSYQNVWVGTDNGLYVLSADFKVKWFRLDDENYRSKNIMGIIMDHQQRIWVSTMNGVYLLSPEDPFENAPEVYHYTTSEGLVDMEANVNALYEDMDGMIWVGTSSALVQINPNLNDVLFSYDLPKLSITGVRLFKEKINFEEYETEGYLFSGVPKKIVFPFSKNHLTFDFIGINNKNPENVYYSYRLLGAEENWSSVSTENSATYSFISPGNYKFQVKSANKNLEWSAPITIDVVINSPYWKTWWFILLVVVAVGSLFYYLLILRINSIKQKKDNERLIYVNKLRNLEQQSLNASMNRHFIFNSLNSIQYFINSSDKKSANKYLSNFAKLIRKNLDSSTQPNFLVSLNEEIERIKLYLELEKMRFNEKFDFTIEIDENMDQEMINVPSMILQPFVENSIIHGVLPKSEKGHIKLSINEENESIIFQVEDDGVGIDDSLNQKESFEGDHKSQGMEITANRIELLRKISGDKLMIIGPFQVNLNNKSTGTKVIIKLPIY